MNVALVVSLVLLVSGLAVGFYGFMIKGVHPISWGILLSAYVFFSLTSAGSTLANSAYALFGYQGPSGELKKIIKAGVWFSLVSVVAAVMTILLEVTHPEKAWAILAFFNPESRIAWMVALYIVYGFFLLVELVLLIRMSLSEEALKKLAVAKTTLALLVVLSALTLYTNLAQVFGSMISIPAWFGAHMAPLFIVAAVYVGVAGQSLFMMLYARREGLDGFLSRFYSILLLTSSILLALMIGWYLLTANYNPVVWASIAEVVKGEYSTLFWLIQVLVGVVLVAALSLAAYMKRNYTTLAVASLLALLAGAFLAYWIIVVPQLVLPEVLDGMYRVAEYSVSLDEALVVAGAVTVWVSLIIAGWEILPLKAGEQPRRLFILK